MKQLTQEEEPIKYKIRGSSAAAKEPYRGRSSHKVHTDEFRGRGRSIYGKEADRN
jgi:hypothetical protein